VVVEDRLIVCGKTMQLLMSRSDGFHRSQVQRNFCIVWPERRHISQKCSGVVLRLLSILLSEVILSHFMAVLTSPRYEEYLSREVIGPIFLKTPVEAICVI
jgi:hypothetical protein